MGENEGEGVVGAPVGERDIGFLLGEAVGALVGRFDALVGALVG
jgi:hypothetical protein